MVIICGSCGKSFYYAKGVEPTDTCLACFRTTAQTTGLPWKAIVFCVACELIIAAVLIIAFVTKGDSYNWRPGF